MNAPNPMKDSHAPWRCAASAKGTLREILGTAFKLPVVPALYMQVASELDSARGSIEFVGRLIARETAMCARILQAANSAALASAQSVNSPYDAVLFLGGERTKAVILFEQILEPFRDSDCPQFSVCELWRHSMSVGSLAARIATIEKAPAAIADRCFTAGLLHDVGKLLFAGNMPDPYATALQRALRQSIPLPQIEEQTFGVNHAGLGALLLSSWGLPPELVAAVGWHHEPSLSQDTGFSLLTAVHAANAVSRELNSNPAEGAAAPIDFNYLAGIGLGARGNYWRRACGCAVKRTP